MSQYNSMQGRFTTSFLPPNQQNMPFGPVNRGTFNMYSPARTGLDPSNPNMNYGFRGSDGNLYSSQFSANLMGAGTTGNMQFPFGGLGELLQKDFEGQQGVVDDINDYRESVLGDLGRMDSAIGMLEDFAQGEGSVDFAQGKEDALGFLDEGISASQDRIDKGQADFISAIDQGEQKALGKLSDARHGAMSAQAISAGRAAGEQSVQMASQMAAAGASPAQIVGAQIQADSNRSQQAAASIAATGAQYDSASAQVMTASAQAKASGIRDFTSMFTNVTMQGAQAKVNAALAYDGMQQQDKALRQQAAVAMGNAIATKSQQAVNIVSALPPQTLSHLGLAGEFFSLVALMGGSAQDYGVNQFPTEMGGQPRTVGY